MVKLYPMLMIMIAVALLIIPGALYNNMSNSGYVQANEPNLTCPGLNGDVTCQGSVAVACQAVAAQCKLNGVSVSFLSQTSPFTQLANGNIMGLFTGLTSAPSGLQGSRGPFDALGGTYLTANCMVGQGADGHQTNAAIGSCTQTNNDQSNMTVGNTATWTNWNFNQNGTAATSLSFYQTGHTAPATQLSCSWIAQINYTTLVNGPGWTYFGCDASKGTPSIGNQIWSYLVAMPVSSGGIAVGHHHWYLFVQLEHQDFDPGQGAGVSTSPFYSSTYENWFQTFKGVLISGGSFASQYFIPGLNGPVLGFLFGLVLLIIGIGFGFALNANAFGTGGGLSVVINEQGTRLAQSLGIGLIVFSPMYSEFATWFTSGNLPYGLDGAAGIMSFIVIGTFFFGVFWQAMSRN